MPGGNPNISKDTVAPSWDANSVAIDATPIAPLATYSGALIAGEVLLRCADDFEISNKEAGTYVPVTAGIWFPLPANLGPTNLWVKAGAASTLYYIVLGGVKTT